ncbi:hypothetical protein ZIOFF_005914 [Zingiber officinale]|uniref:Endoplasmic reticulum vesicle transporter C-terminal domain-containing protein n=1 Tax=Zingiber officinale TaxID=94328 RepID=A0A8J5M1Y7_ZINOF|nr:hypothetical protein ZIOFF_005914 [Zingiber officinale]
MPRFPKRPHPYPLYPSLLLSLPSLPSRELLHLLGFLLLMLSGFSVDSSAAFSPEIVLIPLLFSLLVLGFGSSGLLLRRLHSWRLSYNGILVCTITSSFYILPAQIFRGAKKVNVSHVIHDLSFGPKYPRIHNPLDGTARILDDTSGTFKYYIKIVPTEYRYLSKEVLPTNQFSVTEYFVPMRDFDRSWPAVFFLYDLSPITVTIREERRSFLHFLTRLCVVLGGTFALTGTC